jgi:hypothetical protein
MDGNMVIVSRLAQPSMLSGIYFKEMFKIVSVFNHLIRRPSSFPDQSPAGLIKNDFEVIFFAGKGAEITAVGPGKIKHPDGNSVLRYP